MRIAACSLGHFWQHVLALGGKLPAVEYELIFSEVMNGRCWAGIDANGRVIGIGGVTVPRGGMPGMAWLSVLPGVSRQVAAAVLVMRRGLRAELNKSDGCIRAHVEDGNDNGRRLAELLGFGPTQNTRGSIREWRIYGRDR